MKTPRRLPLAALLSLLAAMILAACAAPTTPQTSNSAAPAPAAGNSEATVPAAAPAPAARVPLDIAFVGAATMPADDFVKTALDEAIDADVTLSLFAAADDYANQLNVRMAGGNPPDMFGVNRVQMAQFAEKGLLLDLTPYLDRLAPTVAYIGEETLRKGTLDGKVYALPKSPQVPYHTYWIRQDWLDKLGLQAPTTLEELKAVAVAFTEQDPDGNGKQDTYGITGGANQLQAFAPIFGAYGVGLPDSVYVKDGKVVDAYFDPAMKDALAYIADLVASGAVDPELAANTGIEHRDKAIQGQAGIVYMDWPNLTKAEFAEQITTVNPNARWAPMAPVKGPAGQFDGIWDIGAAPVMFALPRSLADQPEKLDKVIELLNYVSSDGSLLVQYGLEGRHFNLEGDTVVPTELMAKEAGFTWVYQFTGRPELEYLQTKFAPQAEYIEFAAGQPRIESLAGFLIAPAGYTPADAKTFAQVSMLEFINGSRPLDTYDAFLADLDTTYGYQLFREAEQAQLAALGFVQ